MAPRVVVIGLASDFGCQVQMTNIEQHLLDVLGLIDLSYWQLATSGHMPDDYDVAIVEGAVTTEEHMRLLRAVRETADVLIAIGACAITGGIPALATSGELEARYDRVYGDSEVEVAAGRILPRAVSSVVDVDYAVPGCPIDTREFLDTLSRALRGLSDRAPKESMCSVCKTHENECFWERGSVCLGLITKTGCGARCVTLGRPCSGCRGLAEDANVESALRILAAKGYEPATIVERFGVFNTLEEALHE